jgi:heptaprenylglyceryl phosphate synthase
MGTHWELEWNMLGTNGIIKNNPSLLGVNFDAIFVTQLYNCNYMFFIIMGHIQSSNSFFNYKILHMIVVNYVYIACDKLLRETTCLPILLYKYQFFTISRLFHNVHMLHLVANSTSPYYCDLLSPLLVLSPILIPCC